MSMALATAKRHFNFGVDGLVQHHIFDVNVDAILHALRTTSALTKQWMNNSHFGEPAPVDETTTSSQSLQIRSRPCRSFTMTELNTVC